MNTSRFIFLVASVIALATFPDSTMSADIVNNEVGQKIYSSYCSMCHDTGLAGAPKLGDQQDWGQRIEKGTEVLREHALNGLNAMPPKGACVTCSEDDLWAAVDFMLQSLH